MKYESSITYHSKAMATVKVFADKQTDRQTDKRTGQKLYANLSMPGYINITGTNIASVYPLILVRTQFGRDNCFGKISFIFIFSFNCILTKVSITPGKQTLS